MTKRTAKKWVVKKWVWVVKHGHRFKTRGSMSRALVKAIPQLAMFDACCAYCTTHFLSGEMCRACPIVKSGYLGCNNDNSIWCRWVKDRTKKNAQAMLDLVKKT